MTNMAPNSEETSASRTGLIERLSSYIEGSKDFWVRFRRNRFALVAIVILCLLTLLAIFAPFISPYNPSQMVFDRFMPPHLEHPLGTDHMGRDQLSRIIWGTRISLFVGFVSAGISITIGVLLGSISGYYGGKVDDLIMRFVDFFLVIPTFFLILLVIAMFGSSIWNMMFVIGLTAWPGTTRLIRGQFLSLKEQPFVEAERALGASDFRIIFRCILPNAIHPALVNLSFMVGSAIIIEAALSFLGLGDPRSISWGMMLNVAQRFIRTAWWMAVFPGFFISIGVLSFNLVGDGLNDALNPRLMER
jgi:peptide/nickel transport system permease protein